MTKVLLGDYYFGLEFDLQQTYVALKRMPLATCPVDKRISRLNYMPTSVLFALGAVRTSANLGKLYQCNIINSEQENYRESDG